MNIFEQIEQEVRKHAKERAIAAARDSAYRSKINLGMHDEVLPTFSEKQLERIASAAEEEALQKLRCKLLELALDAQTK